MNREEIRIVEESGNGQKTLLEDKGLGGLSRGPLLDIPEQNSDEYWLQGQSA